MNVETFLSYKPTSEENMQICLAAMKRIEPTLKIGNRKFNSLSSRKTTYAQWQANAIGWASK